MLWKLHKINLDKNGKYILYSKVQNSDKGMKQKKKYIVVKKSNNSSIYFVLYISLEYQFRYMYIVHDLKDQDKL